MESLNALIQGMGLMHLGAGQAVMLLVSLIFAALCWRRKQQPGRLAGALLVGGFMLWLAMLYWTAPLFVE